MIMEIAAGLLLGFAAIGLLILAITQEWLWKIICVVALLAIVGTVGTLGYAFYDLVLERQKYSQRQAS